MGDLFRRKKLGSSHFIQAAKEIILTEGVENASVRKIADQAGYAFTTIYNYYKDLNGLLLDVKNIMINDVIVHMQQESDPAKIFDLEDIKKSNHDYINYFIERPNIFTFFYSYRLHSISESQAEVLDYSHQYLITYRGFVMKGIIKEEEVFVIAKTIIYTIHGLLALYFSDNGMTIEVLYNEIDKSTEYLLKGRN